MRRSKTRRRTWRTLTPSVSATCSIVSSLGSGFVAWVDREGSFMAGSVESLEPLTVTRYPRRNPRKTRAIQTHRLGAGARPALKSAPCCHACRCLSTGRSRCEHRECARFRAGPARRDLRVAPFPGLVLSAPEGRRREPARPRAAVSCVWCSARTRHVGAARAPVTSSAGRRSRCPRASRDRHGDTRGQVPPVQPSALARDRSTSTAARPRRTSSSASAHIRLMSLSRLESLRLTG